MRLEFKLTLFSLFILQPFISIASHGLSIRIPSESATVSVPITVTWTLDDGDPSSFGLMEKDLDDGTIGSVAAVDAGSESSGFAELTFGKTGQFVIQGIQQQSLTMGETPFTIGGAPPQIGVVPDIPGGSDFQPTSTTFTFTHQSSSALHTTTPIPSNTGTEPIPSVSSDSTTTSPFPVPRPSSISSSRSTSIEVTSVTTTTPYATTSESVSFTVTTPDLTSSAASITVTTPITVTTSYMSPSSSSKSTHEGSLSHSAKDAIILAVIGTIFVSGTTFLLYFRRKRFIKQRQQLTVFRERLARIPGLSALGPRLGSQISGSNRTSSLVGDGSIESGLVVARSYPFASVYSAQSSRVVF